MEDVVRALVYECQGRADMALTAQLEEAIIHLLEYVDPEEAQRSRDIVVKAIKKVKSRVEFFKQGTDQLDNAIALMDGGSAKAAQWIGTLLRDSLPLSGLDANHQDWVSRFGQEMGEFYEIGGRLPGVEDELSLPAQATQQVAQQDKPQWQVTGVSVGTSVNGYSPGTGSFATPASLGTDTGWNRDISRAGQSVPEGQQADYGSNGAVAGYVAGQSKVIYRGPTRFDVTIGRFSGAVRVDRQGRQPVVALYVTFEGDMNALYAAMQNDPDSVVNAAWSFIAGYVTSIPLKGLISDGVKTSDFSIYVKESAHINVDRDLLEKVMYSF